MKGNLRRRYLTILPLAGILAASSLYKRYLYNLTKKDISAENTTTVKASSPNFNVTLDKKYCQITCQHDHPCKYPDKLDFRIIVLTFNRANSPRKCLRHLYDLNTLGDRVGVEVWIDRDKDGHVDNATIETANQFKLTW